ncbi:MAG: hypothetical protein KDA51_01420, partial [Planctomycetales bacterium]|nr:hypothetical protein [Planctomycetales bacterium]
WAGRVELLARQVSVEQHVDLEVAATQIAIRQDFEMQVANEALEQLRFAVRKDIADLQSPQVLVNGQLVSVTPVTIIDEPSLIQLQTPLKQPQRLSEHVDSDSAIPEHFDVSDVGERPPSPRNLPRAKKAAEGAEGSVAKATATTDDSLRSTERSGIRSAQPAAAGAIAQWQIYQVHGGPDELIGATHVTIQTSTPWKGDSRPALSTAGAPSAIGARGVDGTKQPRPAAGARPAAPSTPQDINYDVVVPLAQLLLPSSTTHLRQDWSLHTNLQIETLFKSDKLDTADAWLAGQRERPLAEQQLAIELKLQPRHLQGIGPVRIDKCWLQTFVGGGKRRERFAIHVESNIDELRMKLPPEAIIREVKVSVDGFAERLFSYDPQTGVVTIPLGTVSPTGISVGHVVEVSYFLPGELNWVTALNVSPPEILGVEQADQFFWQLLTPAEQHLGWSPSLLTAEWTWKWSGLWWHRVSGKNQQQLEKWIGAVVQQSPPASANSYVMSGRGLEGATRVWVLSRFMLWLPIGLLAIAVSFVALNFAVVRKPAVVLALAAGIASLATLWPDLAVLAGQTAVASLGLVGLVWVVQAGVEARVRRRSVFAARPSTYADRSDQVSASRSGRAIPSPPTTSFGSSAGHHAG